MSCPRHLSNSEDDVTNTEHSHRRDVTYGSACEANRKIDTYRSNCSNVKQVNDSL